MLRFATAGCILMLSLTAGDLDRDGIDDGLEQKLLQQFLPVFYLSAGECDVLPAEFEPGRKEPVVQARNGVVYGRVSSAGQGRLQVQYFHLWGRDCGRASHPLDIEHVSALIEQSEGRWRATHWFAAAHQETACDYAHAARAVVLDAVERGARVWVSQGKHASFLSRASCRRGCGADACVEPFHSLSPIRVLNLGEASAPLNGADWIASRQWDFLSKLRNDFEPDVLARVDSSENGIVILTPSLIPARATVKGLNEGVDGLALADQKTSAAADTAEAHTSRALETGYEKTKNALGNATEATKSFLGFGKKKQP